MDFAALSKNIAEKFPRLSPQLQRAARHVLDRPDDVALMSMRRLATSAGVHPSTMVRLARAFEFLSYNDFREPFQQRLRIRPADYLARAPSERTFPRTMRKRRWPRRKRICRPSSASAFPPTSRPGAASDMARSTRKSSR